MPSVLSYRNETYSNSCFGILALVIWVYFACNVCICRAHHIYIWIYNMGSTTNRRCQDYVYVKYEYQSTMIFRPYSPCGVVYWTAVYGDHITQSDVGFSELLHDICNNIREITIKSWYPYLMRLQSPAHGLTYELWHWWVLCRVLWRNCTVLLRPFILYRVLFRSFAENRCGCVLGERQDLEANWHSGTGKRNQLYVNH